MKLKISKKEIKELVKRCQYIPPTIDSIIKLLRSMEMTACPNCNKLPFNTLDYYALQEAIDYLEGYVELDKAILNFSRREKRNIK